MNLKKFAWMIVIALGITAGFLTGANAAETLKIGVIAPLTGGGAPWGLAAEKAAKYAAQEVNAKGGLNVGGKKYQVEIIAYDDQYKAADAVAAYNRLVNQDNVKFLWVVTSAPTMALAPNVENDKVIMLTTAGVENAVNPASKYMFRANSLLTYYVPGVVAWVKANTKAKSVVVVNPNDESGWYSTEISDGAYKKSGFNVLGKEVYERAQKDFAPLMTKIIGMKPDIIELASTPPATAGLIVRQARDLGFKGMFVQNAGSAIPEIISTAGVQGAEGLISQHQSDPYSKGYLNLTKLYRKDVGQDPNQMIVINYDGIKALLRAIELSGDINDTAKVSDAMFNKVFPLESVQGGKLKLGGPEHPNQIVTFSFISIVKKGKAVIVGKI